MPISESLAFPGFEELIYVWDSSSLINMRISGNLRELREFAEHHNGRIRIPIPIGKEIGKRDDDLRAWWLRNQAILGTKFYSGREHKLRQEITVKFAKEPFQKGGKRTQVYLMLIHMQS